MARLNGKERKKMLPKLSDIDTNAVVTVAERRDIKQSAVVYGKGRIKIIGRHSDGRLRVRFLTGKRKGKTGLVRVR